MAAVTTKTIAENRVVRHEYFVLETYEVGIELSGTEVKSIRNGRVNLKDSYCNIHAGEKFSVPRASRRSITIRTVSL